MNKIYCLGLIAASLFWGTACDQPTPSQKRTQYENLKNKRTELDAQIKALKEELIASGEIKINDNSKVLVDARPIKPRPFLHRVELRGAVASKKNVIVTARAIAEVQSIQVKEGQSVAKGQELVRLDDEITRNSIAELETSLELAIDLHLRQKRLWDQNIGTEVQYLQAKNNQSLLTKKLSTLKSQLDLYSIKSPFDGVVDDIMIREGEIAQPGVMPILRLINDAESYISADISEFYLGKFKKNQVVGIYFPIRDHRIKSRVKTVGQVIKTDNRTFKIEIDLPKVDFEVKPNQVVILDLIDYSSDNALVVPSELVQKDNKGTFVYGVIDRDGDKRAYKYPVEVGFSYDNETEIVQGLNEGEVIAYAGYRDLSPNSIVKIANGK